MNTTILRHLERTRGHDRACFKFRSRIGWHDEKAGGGRYAPRQLWVVLPYLLRQVTPDTREGVKEAVRAHIAAQCGEK